MRRLRGLQNVDLRISLINTGSVALCWTPTLLLLLLILLSISILTNEKRRDIEEKIEGGWGLFTVPDRCGNFPPSPPLQGPQLSHIRLYDNVTLLCCYVNPTLLCNCGIQARNLHSVKCNIWQSTNEAQSKSAVLIRKRKIAISPRLSVAFIFSQGRMEINSQWWNLMEGRNIIFLVTLLSYRVCNTAERP